MAAEKNILLTLGRCWDRKSDLHPGDTTGERRRMLEFIRGKFSELEKKDCQSLVTCLKLLIFKHITTLASAKKVYPKFKDLIPFLYKSTSYNAAEIEFGNIRKALPENLKEYGDSIFKTSAVQKSIISRFAQESLERSMAKPFKVTLPQILENIARDIESSDFSVVASALELASGSRAIEILSSKVAQFKQSTIPEYIIQVGQAKSKKSGKTRVQDPIEKPIIGTTVKKWLEKLAFVRSYTTADVSAGMSNSALASKYEPAIVSHVKELYPNLGKGQGTHALRAVYSKASYQIFEPTSSALLWVKKVLGHSNYSSVKNYDSVIVDRGPVARQAEVPVLLTELQARISALESRPAEIIAPDASGGILRPKKPKRKPPKPFNKFVEIIIPV